MPDGADRLRGQPRYAYGATAGAGMGADAVPPPHRSRQYIRVSTPPFLLASAFERCLWLEFVMNFLTRALLGKTVISNKALTSAYTPQPMGNGRAHV